MGGYNPEQPRVPAGGHLTGDHTTDLAVLQADPHGVKILEHEIATKTHYWDKTPLSADQIAYREKIELPFAKFSSGKK